MPDAFFGGKTFRRVLRAEDPRVIGQAPLRVRARVCVDELACRRHANAIAIECEILGVFDEVEQVCVAATELPFAVYAERVIPDHPAPAVESQLALEDHLQLGGEVVADSEPEGAGRLERVDQRLAPL